MAVPKWCKFPQNLNRMANQSGVNVKRTADGRYRIEGKGTGGSVIREYYNTEGEVRNVLSRLLNPNLPELDGNLAAPFRGTPMGANAPRIGDQLNVYEKINAKARNLAGAGFTGVFRGLAPVKAFASFVESNGFGKPLTEVWNVMETNLRRMHEAFANEVRPGLGGLHFDQAINALDKMGAGLGREQAELSVLAGEAFTRQELIRPGVLLKNGIDADHVMMAREFERLGVAEDIPRLLRTNAIIDDVLTNRPKLIGQGIPTMRRLIQEGKLPGEMTETLDRVSFLTGNESTVLEVMRSMNLPENEAKALVTLRALMKARIAPELMPLINGVRINQQPDFVYNIPAIFRYAIAPEAKAGFANGFEQFAAERGMTEQAKAVARERKKILEEAFKGTGYSVDQVLGAQLPVFRQFIDIGMYPGRQYGAAAEGAINGYTRMLFDDLPEGAEILSRRVLSGHLNPFELHPSVTTNKHVRNILMRQYVDPHLPKVKQSIRLVESVHEGAGKVMGDYFHEAIGLPDEGFKQWNELFQSTGRYLGLQFDDNFVERMVFTLTKLTSQASIPFRPALVLRNFTQTSLTLSMIGPEAWKEGLAIALGRDTGGKFSADAMKAAIQRVIKAGAIDADVLPLGAQSNIMGFDAATFKNAKIEELAKWKDELFKKGFSWYRHGDDFGRVVAFEGMNFRARKYLGQYMEGKINYETFKKNAKVKIFHEAVEAEFDRIFATGEYDQAINYLGKELADKAHFNYGNANHPVGWTGPIGRLLGQFGTFPTQYLQTVIDGATRGTMKDRAEFIATHTAFNSGIVAAGLAMDVDLESWSMFPSLKYTGGPYADLFLNAAVLMSGNDAEKSLARRSLSFMFPSMENPRSIFIPGSYFVGDLFRARDADGFSQMLMQASGIRVLGQGAKKPESALMDGLAWIDEIGGP